MKEKCLKKLNTKQRIFILKMWKVLSYTVGNNKLWYFYTDVLNDDYYGIETQTKLNHCSALFIEHKNYTKSFFDAVTKLTEMDLYKGVFACYNTVDINKILDNECDLLGITPDR